MNNSLESPSITNENYQNVINTNLSIDELKIPSDFNQKKRTLSNNQISANHPINTFVKVREINFSYPSYNNTPFQNYFNHFLKETFGMNNTLNNPNYYFHNQNYQIQNNYESEYKNGSIDNSNIEKIMGNLNLENSSVFGGKKEQNNFQVNAYEDNDLIKSHIIIGNNQVRNDFFPEQEIKPFNPNYYIKNDLYNHKREKSSGLHGYNFKEKIIDKEIFINYFRRTYRVNLKSFNYYDIKLINPKEIEEKIGKEKKRIEKIKKEMFERRKESRKNMDKKDTNLKLNEVLEDMCIYGITTKKELEEEKKINPNKFFELKEVLNMKEKDKGLYALGILSTILERTGIKAEIQKEDKEINQNKDNIKDDGEEASTCLDFITNGLAYKKKYDLHFEFGERRNEELLYNEDKCKNFIEQLKLKISKDYRVPIDKIIITFPQKGSFHVQVIFQSDEFNDLDLEEFKSKFKYDKDFRDLCYLKDIHSDILMGACKLTKKQLDSKGNRSSGWPKGEKRGNKPYYSPEGWIGIGLKVEGKYENDEWLGMKNKDGEWCVAYHGVGCGQNSDKVKNIAGLIYKGGFKPGQRQAHKNCDDQFHPGQKVGEGVYCTNKIEVAEEYAGTVEVNGKRYKMVIMSRVRPDKIRHCNICDDSKEPFNYWVMSGTTDDIRPYRLLYKCVYT